MELRPGLDADLVDGGIFDVTPEPIGEGVRLYRLRAWCSSPNQSEREFSVHLALIELCTRRGYDLLHGMYASTAGFAAAYAAAEHGVPAVVSLRGNDIHRDVFDGPKFGQLRWALEHATAITSVSAEGLRRAEILTDCAGKGSVILNSIDPLSYRDGVAHVAHGQPLIGSLAKFRAKKGLPTLIQAFRQVCTRHPGARLLLVGAVVNDERDAMLGLIADAGIADRVTVTGYVEQADAMRYLRGMDVFVLSSIHEGCPNALLEAMAAGVPIVATRCGAVPEMLTHGEEAILVPPGSAEEDGRRHRRTVAIESGRIREACHAGCDDQVSAGARTGRVRGGLSHMSGSALGFAGVRARPGTPFHLLRRAQSGTSRRCRQGRYNSGIGPCRGRHRLAMHHTGSPLATNGIIQHPPRATAR